MKDHPEDELLSAWLDGESRPEEAQRIRLHLAACASCRNRLGALGETGLLLAPLRAVSPPPTLMQRLLAEWDSRWGRLRVRPVLGFLALSWMPALAVGLALALVSPWYRPSRSKGNRVPVPSPPNPRVATAGVEGRDPDRPLLFPLPGWSNPLIQPAMTESAIGTEAAATPQPETAHWVQARSHASAPRRHRAGNAHSGYGLTRKARPTDLPASDPTAKEDVSPPSEVNSGPAAVQLASSKDAETSPVFQLVVEDDPQAAPPPPPKNTSCEWKTQDAATGQVASGQVTRSYSGDGQLERVHLQISLNGPEDAGADPSAVTPEPASTEGHRPSQETAPSNLKGDTNETPDTRPSPASLSSDPYELLAGGPETGSRGRIET